MFLIHHLLEHGGSIDARHVVVLEGGHKRHGASGHDEVVSINIGNLLRINILDGYAAAFEQVPHDAVEQYAAVVVAGKGLGDVETAHSAKLFLFFEEEELVGLHIELAADAGIAIHHYITDTKSIKLLTASQTGRTGTDDCNLGFVYLDFARLRNDCIGHIVPLQLADLFDIVDRSDADASYAAIDQHLAGTALADAALQAARLAINAVTVNRIASLMQSSGNGVTFTALNLLAIEAEFNNLTLWDVKNRVFFDLIHKTVYYGLIICRVLLLMKKQHKISNYLIKNKKKSDFFTFISFADRRKV